MSRTRDAGSTRTHVRRLEVGGSDLVAKSVRGRARSHLRREAEVLGHLEGVPVVELVALRDNDDRTDLVTVDAGAHDLSNPVGLRPALLLTSIAEAADALDQLHRAGWVHGAFCGEHIVVDHGGRATLCSLGSAVPHAAGEHGVADDLEQLRRLIDRLASRRDPTWTSAELRWWRRRSRRLVRVLARSGSWTADAAQIAAITRSLDPPTSGSGSQDHPEAGNPALRLGRAPTGLLLGIITIAATALLWTGRSPTVAGSSSTDDSAPHDHDHDHGRRCRLHGRPRHRRGGRSGRRRVCRTGDRRGQRGPVPHLGRPSWDRRRRGRHREPRMYGSAASRPPSTEHRRGVRVRGSAHDGPAGGGDPPGHDGPGCARGRRSGRVPRCHGPAPRRLRLGGAGTSHPPLADPGR